MFKCPKCGAPMRFNISTQKLFCDYCEQSVSPEQYMEKQEKEAEVNETLSETFEVTVFTCPSCGGEIYSTENEMTGKCPFCGESSVFAAKVSGEKRPSYILPFSKTEEQARNAYMKKVSSALFVPKELKDPEFVKEFRGIYLPYWSYTVKQGFEEGPAKYKAKGTRTSGNTEYTYDCSYDVQGIYKGITYDASSSFDDNIGEEIAPFSTKKMRRFNEAYLAGFYADSADVPAKVYDMAATAFAEEQTISQITDAARKRKITLEPSAEPVDFGTAITRTDRALFPVWFLTWRNKDRVAYSVVNGETGRVSCDIPVDIKKYLSMSLLIALPIFLILNLLISVTAPLGMALSALLTIFIEWIYLFNLRDLITDDTHEKDSGYRYSKGTLKKENGRFVNPVKKKKKRNYAFLTKFLATSSTVVINLAVITFFVLIDSGAAVLLGRGGILLFESRVKIYILSAALIPTIIYACLQIYRSPWKSVALEAFLPILAVITAIVTAVIDPVRDIYYYLVMIICLLASLFAIVANIRKYNMLATRPVPDFHDRKDVDGPGDPKAAKYKTGSKGTTIVSLIIAVMALSFFMKGSVTAYSGIAPVYTDPSTGYGIFIDDKEELLSPEEEKQLAEEMKPITQYGNAFFLTCYAENYYDAEDYLFSNYEDYYYENGTAFVIDTYWRELRLQNMDDVESVVSSSLSDSIVDNVYHYASNKDYYTCAAKVFRQVYTLLDGGRIARPMKYICNALLSLILALLANYVVIRIGRRRKAAKTCEKVVGITAAANIMAGAQVLLKKRHISSSSGSGGGHGGGGHGGGGGGGHHSSGGSHHF